MPCFHRSPWAHTPIFSARSVAVPLLLSFLPRPPRSGCLHLVSSARRCAPRERPHSRPPISTCGIALIFLCRKQKDQGPCRSGTAGQRGEGLGISYPALAPSLSLFSLSFSNSLITLMLPIAPSLCSGDASQRCGRGCKKEVTR